MQKSSIYIYFLAASIGCISIIYFLSLLLHLPHILTTAAIILAEYFIFRWLNKLQCSDEEHTSPIRYAVFIYGIACLAYMATGIAPKHGAWDAWAIWNLHAGYLAETQSWKNMFLNSVSAHADYPLALPSFLAFLHNLTVNELLVNYSFHLLIAVSIPSIIYLQTYKRAWLLSAIAFILLCKDDFYITIATYQMADTLIAFFLLLAVIAVDNIETDKRYIIVCAAMLGCCLWTKNEGAVLAILFTMFFYKDLLLKGAYKYSLIGIAIPLTVYVIFKLGFAPQNDILESQNKTTLSLLTEPERYKMIYTAWKDSFNAHYYAIACMVALCILIMLIRRILPDKRILFILSACIAYSLVYLISPHDLEWHLKTSIDRLIHQLMPISVYASLMYLTNTTFFNFRARFGAGQ